MDWTSGLIETICKLVSRHEFQQLHVITTRSVTFKVKYVFGMRQTVNCRITMQSLLIGTHVLMPVSTAVPAQINKLQVAVIPEAITHADNLMSAQAYL